MSIVGAEVTQLRFDFAFSIAFDATAEARIETTFSVSTPAGHTEVFDPDKDLAQMGPLLTLHQTKIVSADADETGHLNLHFSDGRQLDCAPDPDYEAWTFNGPDGLQLVAMPGGGLAVWGGMPD